MQKSAHMGWNTAVPQRGLAIHIEMGVAGGQYVHRQILCACLCEAKGLQARGSVGVGGICELMLVSACVWEVGL